MSGDSGLRLLVEAAINAAPAHAARVAADLRTLRAHIGQVLPDGRTICDHCSGYFSQPVVLLDDCPSLRQLAATYRVEPLPPPPSRS